MISCDNTLVCCVILSLVDTIHTLFVNAKRYSSTMWTVKALSEN